MDINDNNSNNSGSGNNGNKGKFSDRLKKMRRDRLKRRKSLLFDEEESTLKTTGRNILKIFLAIPSVVYSHVVSDKKDDDIEGKNDTKQNFHYVSHEYTSDVDTVQSNLDYSIDRKMKVNKIRDINVSLLKKKREIYLNSSRSIDYKNNDIKFVDTDLRIVKLQKEIIDLIKKKLVNNINELEILQSELYVLNELQSGDIYLSECQQDIKEIKKLLSKIKSLKEKYDYLKDNVDFEYMLEYGDDILVDKILELKELCSRDDIKHTVESYKLLDEYKFLYLKIDKLQEDTVKFEDYKAKKIEELKGRDIDFDKLRDSVYNIDRDKEQYDSFVKSQELFLSELDDKISKIDSYERVSYRLKGFNQLLGNSFKYLGLLLVNPLKGLIPGIATQTLVTKNLVHNLYNNLQWEENRKMVYEAIDYSNSINTAINNLGETSSLIDSTLDDIIRLKKQYKKEFSRYEGSFSGYKDAVKKINKIENAVFGSKIKVELMQARMKEKERQNNEKMKRVKKLNSSNNT